MKVKEYFSNREHWCQGVHARTDGGKPAVSNDRIKSMCLTVAIISRFEGDSGEAIRRATSLIKNEYGYDSISQFNDAVDYETMMEVVEKLKL
jgi:hypothetical protein